MPRYPRYSMQITIYEAWRLFKRGDAIIIECQEKNGPELFSLKKETSPDFSFSRLQKSTAFFVALPSKEISKLTTAALIQSLTLCVGVILAILGGCGFVFSSLNQKVVPIFYVDPPYCYWISFLLGTYFVASGITSEKVITIWADFEKNHIGRDQSSS